MATKINDILKLWKPGLVLTSSYLNRNGLNYVRQSQYRKSGWLEAVGVGALKRSDDLVNWPGALRAIQHQLKLKVHLGGKSALLQHGYAHYAQFRENVIYIFAARDTKLPAWFLKCNREQKLNISHTSMLPYETDRGFSERTIEGFPLILSAPERAVLEMLYFIPSMQSFDEAFKIMESLTSLRAELLQYLLETCSSIKVKRLFLYMAEKQNHFWYESLYKSRINLGSGKRQIIKNGIYDKKYRITVPKGFEF